jgi:MtN3 and saliva related transmembrane protein
MEFVTITGLFVSMATGSALLPQVCKIIKEKKAESVSLWMLAVLFIGVVGMVWSIKM